jgi:hypothetical protein
VKSSQRWLTLVTLLILAIAFATYCLDYRKYDLYSYGGRLFLGSADPAPIPVIDLSPGSRSHPEKVLPVTVSGLYPRPGLTVVEAAIGGLLIPFLMVICTCYVALGMSPTDARAQVEKVPAIPSQQVGDKPVADWTSMSLPPADRRETTRKTAAVVGAIFPILFIIDTPSMMLLNCVRLPRWVFAFLVLRALAGMRGHA